MTPERIADYELVEYLTAGGMADLYLARSPSHRAPVVLKTIQRRYAEMTRVVRMFVDEGRIAQALDHPNIVRIHDVGDDRGAYYIAMEFIAGRDLLAIARRGIEAGRFLPVHLAAAIIAQVATGLVYAHEKLDDNGRPLRIVHCDISPGNVVVSFGGTAKIVDFGIARAAIQLRAEDHSIVGKFNYMAPEQIRGEALDARVDLFSLGIILYELTVGVGASFRGKARDVKLRILNGTIPRPRDARPELPESLERIILRTLAVDPAQRYPTARALRTDLLAFIAEDGHPAGKREIAEYLREIFDPASLRGPQIGDEPSTDESGHSDEEFANDEELSLEAPIPGLAELVIDADDPEPGPVPIEQPVPIQQPPSTERPAPVSTSEMITQPTPALVPPRASAKPPAPTHPHASQTELVLAILAILIALMVYLLIRA